MTTIRKLLYESVPHLLVAGWFEASDSCFPIVPRPVPCEHVGDLLSFSLPLSFSLSLSLHPSFSLHLIVSYPLDPPLCSWCHPWKFLSACRFVKESYRGN